jgi:hypothetical protein
MIEVTEENYLTFLVPHGQCPDCAERVVARHDNTEGYHTLIGVRLWVEASKMVLKLNG